MTGPVFFINELLIRIEDFSIKGDNLAIAMGRNVKGEYLER